MLNIFSLKKEVEINSETQGKKKKRVTGAQLRITKDISELELPKTCKTEFPDPDDLLNFHLVISPDEGNTFTLVHTKSKLSKTGFL